MEDFDKSKRLMVGLIAALLPNTVASHFAKTNSKQEISSIESMTTSFTMQQIFVGAWPRHR
jgi:hypothetical protein